MAYVNELWEGDPGGRGWQVRVPAGATWLSLRDDEDDPLAAAGRSPRLASASRPWARAPGRRGATDAPIAVSAVAHLGAGRNALWLLVPSLPPLRVVVRPAVLP